MSVARLEREMSAAELEEWRAYYEVEPFGEWRADLRMGILAALLGNINRDPVKRPEPFAASDFMPTFDGKRVEKRQSSAEMLQTARLITAMYNGMQKEPTA